MANKKSTTKSTKAIKSIKKDLDVGMKFDSNEWEHLFRVFSYRNKMVLLNLIALTIINFSLVVSLMNPDYFYLKIGGAIGLVIMVYALMVSINNTKNVYTRMRNIYYVSDVLYGIIIFMYMVLIIIIQ